MAEPASWAFEQADGRLYWFFSGIGAHNSVSVRLSTSSTLATSEVYQGMDNGVDICAMDYNGAPLVEGVTYYYTINENTAGTPPTHSFVYAGSRDSLTGIVQASSIYVLNNESVEVSVRSDGAVSPTLTLGYSKLGDATTWTAIATLTGFSITHASNDLDITIADNGDIYVAGFDSFVAPTPSVPGSTTSFVSSAGQYVRVTKFTKTSAYGWATVTTGVVDVSFFRSVNLTWIPGVAGGTPRDSLFLIGRRYSKNTKYGPADMLILATDILPSLTVYTIRRGTDTPPTGGLPPAVANASYTPVDVVQRQGDPTILNIFAGGFASMQIINGAIFSTFSATALSLATTARQTKYVLLATATNTLSLISVISDGTLYVDQWTEAGGGIARLTFAPSLAAGGNFGRKWDAWLDKRTNTVKLLYVTAAATPTLQRVDVALSTMAIVVDAVAATYAASSALRNVRAPHGRSIDERRALIEIARVTTGGTRSLEALDDRTGNVAPTAPTLVDVIGFDASAAFTFNWIFADSNTFDLQTGYDLQVQRVSDNVNVVNVAGVVSPTPSHTVTGGTLANPVNYRWRVRTRDTLGELGAWSAYDSFVTADVGTLTIIDPVADTNLLDESTYLVEWSYTSGGGFTQTARRVRMIRVDNGAVLLDTTMQSTASNTYTVTFPSGIQVDLIVSITSSAPGTPVVTSPARRITSTFLAPDAPTIVGVASGNGVDLTVTNPTPTGSKPDATTNYIERRPAGGGEWLRVAALDPGTGYFDRVVASGRQYEYRAVAAASTGEQPSDSIFVTAPTLIGVWIHDPTDPSGTEQNYLYANGRSGKLNVGAVSTSVMGRIDPIVEFGEIETRNLTMTVPIPFNELDAITPTLETFLINRRAILYRDGRGRCMFMAFTDPLGVTDDRTGESVALNLVRVSYNEVVA